MTIDISYSKLTASQWEEKIFYRAVNVKFPYQLDDLIKNVYPKKIAKLKERLSNRTITFNGDWDEAKRIYDEENTYLNDKIIRLTDKLYVCQKMLDLRNSKAVSTKGEWAMHGTLYYIDYTNGNDANDGLAANNDHSWKTINKYTTTTVRTAGDIAYVRANQTHSCGADIVMDEDGTAAAYISIIGCDATTNDPWSDSNNTLPTLDFGDAAYQININGDDFWKLDRLNIIQSADSLGNIQISGNSIGTYIANCVLTDNSHASVRCGISLSTAWGFKIENCTFKDNINSNLYFTGNANGLVTGCTFNGGALTTDYGVRAQGFVNIMITDSTFGSTTAHDTQDISNENFGYIKCRNCTFNKASLYVYYTNSLPYITSEDDDGTFAKQIVYHSSGIVTRDTGVTRDGGASSSAKLMPVSGCGIYAPLSISPFDEYDFKVWLTKDIEKTITIYMRSVTTWSGSYPTAAQCYVKFSYLSNAVTAARTEVVTNETFSDATTWVAFDSGAITPLQTGWVYIKVYLGKYTASNGIYCDIAPVVS